MNFPFFIAKRYLISKKSTNIINIISFISLIGVAFGTMAFIVVLSVFNGLENLVRSLFNSFDPDLRIELAEGKSFAIDSTIFDKIKQNENIAYYSFVIEENAMLEYDNRQLVATIKGVDDNYHNVTGVDSTIYEGNYVLKHNNQNFAVVGYGISSKLGMSTNMDYPITIWAPVRTHGIGMDVHSAFNSNTVNLGGIFSVQQDYDNKYIILPLDFVQELMKYGNRATAIEIRLTRNANQIKTQKNLASVLGKGFVIKNRFEQKQLAYKIMRTEKWAIIAILSFILLISSFNIIGSLVMLIIEKKNDIRTFQSMGSDISTIRKIFMIEGWLISVIGAVIGLILGVILSLIQQKFGWITFPSQGTFVQNVYPVEVHFIDVIFVFVVVVSIGYLVAKYPVRYITNKIFSA